MTKIKLVIIIYLLLFVISQFLIPAAITYAEEIQPFYGYNSNLDFKKDYKFKALEYNFSNKKDKQSFNSFIKNSAYINQNGNQNESSICQIGNIGSIVELIQIGNENKAKIKQFANYTQAEVFQFGNNHDLSVEQWGSEAEIYVIQSGNNYEDKEIKIIQF